MDILLTPGPRQLTASAKLRLYETILQATPDLIYVFDLQHRFIYANQALLTMWGCTLEEAMGKTCLELGYEPWHAAMHDEEIERVIATRAPIRGDVPFMHHILGRRIYDYIFTPVMGTDGHVEAIAGATRDVTERTQQEEALQKSEQRFSAMVNASSDLIYRMSHDWRESEIIAGRNVGNLPTGLSSNWMDFIHPDDRLRVAAAADHARRTLTPFEAEHRVSRDGNEWAWVSSRAVPIQHENGEVREWFGAATDITERIRDEQHLRLLVNELNHRVKNTLSIVQSMALQTLRSSKDVASAAEQIESRLLALSQAHDVLTQENWERASVADIVRTAIAPACSDGTERFEISGNGVWLDPRRAVALSMALHELCTNAVKYGALSVPDGRVCIAWRREDDGTGARFELAWHEHGGPAVTPPARRGFGSRLVERGLRHDLGGEVTLEFPPGGVVCRIQAPVPLDNH